MRTTDLKDLLATVEAIRQEMHPTLSASFLAAVVAAEEANQEDDDRAMGEIESALAIALLTAGER